MALSRKDPVPPRGPFGWDRDWPRLAVLIALIGVWWVTLWQLHPDLLLSSSTTTGGDTGAHFILPAFLKSTFLPGGKLTGWYPGWYDGFSLYTYYFVLPDLVAALASYVIPYGVAFKLATVLGSLLLPVCAWGMGRLFRLKDPIPACLAVATLPLLFDPTFTIDGGNLFSTLAGEYAFSLGLAVSLVVIGLFARGLVTGKGSIITPIALAACLACHLVPTLYALLAAGVLTLVAFLFPNGLLGDDAQGSSLGLLPGSRPSRLGALWWGVRSGILGLALAGWWLLPFYAGQKLVNPMGYVNDTDYVAKLLPHADWWVAIVALLAVVVGLIKRSRFAIVFAICAVAAGGAFILDPQGSLWNERLIPLWFTSLYLLAGWLLGVTLAVVARWWRRRAIERSALTGRPLHSARWLPGAVGGPVVALLIGLVVVVPPLVPSLVPASALEAIGVTPGANQVASWAAWNYSGYEGKDAYPEYRGLMTTMTKIGRTNGCGRAMWEYSSDLDRFGTPMALMLLPYWTNGCIGSQEGLFFESSATVPYHFLIQAEVSSGPSDPQVGLPYSGVDIGAGVQHLQMLGVRYLMLSSPATKAQAASNPSLTLIGTSGPWAKVGGALHHTVWNIYEIADSAVVAPLTHLPVVVPGIGRSSDRWKHANVAWFMDKSRWDVPLAESGPTSWPRGTAKAATSPAVVPTTVSAISHAGSSLSFHVGRLDVPVVVKISYDPRWHVTGAAGPYRISPNLMAVVPTSHQVTMSYGTDSADNLGFALTALAIACLAGMGIAASRRKRRPLHHR